MFAGHGVPYALDAARRVVTPDEALSPAGLAGRALLTCASCGERISPVRAHDRRYRRSDSDKSVHVRAHFAHREGSRCRATRETIEHLCAKYLLAQCLEDAAAHGGSVVIHTSCGACGLDHQVAMGLPIGSRAEVEVASGPFRLDVAVLARDQERSEGLLPGVPAGPGGLLLAVEVLVAHEVPEGKAERLDTLWAEVRANLPELLAGVTGRADVAPNPATVTLMAVNTNLFAYRPCECGNTEPTRARAEQLGRDRAAAREAALRAEAEAQMAARRAQEQARRAAAQLEMERSRAEAAVRAREAARVAALGVDARREELRRAAAGGRYPTLKAFVAAFLQEHAPDRTERLGPYRLVVAPCPGCRATQVFFDTRGMLTYPHWNARLHHRRSTVHPWESRCVACGWTGLAPTDAASGALTHEVRGRGLDGPHVAERSTLRVPVQQEAAEGEPRPWWQRE